MPRNNDRDRGKRTVKDTRPRGKKKVCIFCKDRAVWVDANGRAGTRRTRYTLSVEAHVSIGNTTHALGAWTLYSKGAFRAFG